MRLNTRFAASVMLCLFLMAGCSVIEEPVFKLGLHLERSRSDMEPGTVMVEGKTIRYLEREGSGETMVFLHGFGADKENWLRFARYIPEEYRIIAPDLPGHGESSLDFPGPYDVHSMERRLALALEKLDVKRFHLAGNSMGGLVAMLYSMNHPEKVISLGLFDSAGIIAPVKSDFFRELEQGRNPLLVSSRKDFDSLMSLCFFEAPNLPWPAMSVMTRRRVKRNEHQMKMWNDLFIRLDDTPVREGLPGLSLPALVLWGDRDRVLDISGARVIRSLIPGARLIVLENCGHVPMVEQPEKSANAYMGFVRDVRSYN